MTDLSLISWNIHRGRGNDGHVDPARTADVLLTEVCATTPDILVLQEADEEQPPHHGILDLSRIMRQTGLRHAHSDPGARWSADSHGFLGVIVFLQPDITVEDIALLDLPGHCHRGAVVIDAARSGVAFRLIATHLSLSQALRIAQFRTIGQHLFRRADRQTILAGDLNEWRPWGGAALSPRVIGQKFEGAALATFPSRRPLVALDRVLATAPARIIESRVLDAPGIRATSDHRPLVAKIKLSAV